MLGGRAADELFTGTVSAGASSDIERASKLAFNAVTTMGLGATSLFTPQTDVGRADAEKEARGMVEAAYLRVLNLLRDKHANAVLALRDRLLTEKVVSAHFAGLVSD